MICPPKMDSWKICTSLMVHIRCVIHILPFIHSFKGGNILHGDRPAGSPPFLTTVMTLYFLG